MSEETCNCPCCQQGIEAPHEYHLERRPMPGVTAGCACGVECRDLRDGCRYRSADVALPQTNHSKEQK
jgi:hypothetical protein